MPFTTQQIAELVGGELVGPPDVVIASMERIDAAQPDQVTFVSDERYAERWHGSRAGAAIVPRTTGLAAANGRALIRVANVDQAVAKLLEALAPPAVAPDAGVHATAVVEHTAVIGGAARVGAHCYVGRGAHIGEGAVLHPNVTVLDGCRIGPGTVLWPGVVVRERCVIGARCTLHPNVSIGGDGFGFRPAPGGNGLVKVPHIGNVVIGDDVEIGSGTCVDRAKFGSTEIGDMTKIDNLCQIAHNCRIGRRCLIAGNCGIAGSVVVGDGVAMGGCVAVKDHVTIGAGAKIAGSAAVMHDVPPGAMWGGYPAKDAKIARREVVSMSRLPELVKMLKAGGQKSKVESPTSEDR